MNNRWRCSASAKKKGQVRRPFIHDYVRMLKYLLEEKKHLLAQYDLDNTGVNIYARNYNNNNIRNRIAHNNGNYMFRSNINNNNINYHNNINNRNNSNPITIQNQFDGIGVLRTVRNTRGTLDDNWSGEGLESRWDN